MAQTSPQIPITSFSDLQLLSAAKFRTYRAHDVNLGHNVVLKVFPATTSANLKYINEKSHLTDLNHENVIKLIQAVDFEPEPINSSGELASYLVLEHALHGDLHDAVNKSGRMREELARTVFHQLVEGLSYLHSKNIAHLDIKMENLLIGKDYKIKLADFDLSQSLNSNKLEATGTAGYRAPEIKNGQCENYRAADLYSAGIILFILLAGFPPFSETASAFGYIYDKFYKFLKTNKAKFWTLHSRYVGGSNIFSEDFKQLFSSLLDEDPSERPTIEILKQNSWYCGPILKEEEYIVEMKKYMRH